MLLSPSVCARVLVQSGPAELHDAAMKGDLAAVNALLDRGVDVNARYKVTARALHSACSRTSACSL